ncbi:hypothetical protein AB0F64_14795 [Streptomyces sp. NPDC026294]|uniref:hypothetical protein n=1 Tax=Streptomyces sp. NPDC026294 TaxID=3155362 RepID=UPI0033F1E4D9
MTDDDILAVPDPERALRWLHERLTPGTDAGRHVVTELVPEGYPAYVRVFHTWTLEEIPGLRRTWREMAAASGAHFHGELMGGAVRREVLSPPVGEQWEVFDGEPDPATRQGLVEILSAATAADQRVFYSYELARELRGEETLVWTSSLSGLEAVRARTGEEYAGPEHWWPEDRGWVVACDWDLCSTYVACSEALAERLVGSDLIEAVRVAPAVRVDNGADHLDQRS